MCFAAGALIGNIARSLIAYFGSLVASVLIIIVLAYQPLNSPYVSEAGLAVLQRVMLIAIFRMIFPFPIILSLAAALIGAAVAERYV